MSFNDDKKLYRFEEFIRGRKEKGLFGIFFKRIDNFKGQNINCLKESNLESNFPNNILLHKDYFIPCF